MSEETQRVLAGRQAALTSIAQHPNWPELVAEVGRKRERIEKVVLARALGTPGATDQYELEFYRGFIAGMTWIAQVPNVAEGALERFLREQGMEGVTSV